MQELVESVTNAAESGRYTETDIREAGKKWGTYCLENMKGNTLQEIGKALKGQTPAEARAIIKAIQALEAA